MIYIASDHAAYHAKRYVLRCLLENNISAQDLGTHSEESCPYPDYAIKVIRKIQADTKAEGILLCGSGIGMSMVANRFRGVRAALCHNEEQALLARQHNNANVLCLGAKVCDQGQLWSTIRAWLSGKFEGGRHQERLKLFELFGEQAR